MCVGLKVHERGYFALRAQDADTRTVAYANLAQVGSAHGFLFISAHGGRERFLFTQLAYA